MQGRSEDQRDLLDVESVAGHLLPAGSVFAFLAEHRHRLFPDAMFDDLFPSGPGRPSVPPDVMASVIVLQTLHGLSDRDAADAVTFDLRWKAACGIAIDAVAFHPSTLTYWRRRLAASDRPHRIFEVVRELIVETGAVRGRNRRALDSTVLDDAVARQDTVTQLIAAVRRVGRDVPDAADALVSVCCAIDYSQPGKPTIAWDDPAARDDLGLAAGQRRSRPDSPRWTSKRSPPPVARRPKRSLCSPWSPGRTWSRRGIGRHRRPVADRPEGRPGPDDLDRRPEARHTRKSRENRQEGFKAHLVVEPDTGLTTAAG